MEKTFASTPRAVLSGEGDVGFYLPTIDSDVRARSE